MVKERLFKGVIKGILCVLIVIIDGKFYDDVIIFLEEFKQFGVIVLFVEVGKCFNKVELYIIVSNLKEKYVFIVDFF